MTFYARVMSLPRWVMGPGAAKGVRLGTECIVGYAVGVMVMVMVMHGDRCSYRVKVRDRSCITITPTAATGVRLGTVLRCPSPDM